MIYSDSKLEFDQFQNSLYVARAAYLSGNNTDDFAEWNWLKQQRSRARGLPAFRKQKSPRERSGGF
jgi:hypothetical protein